jgi:hypothetical protein
VGLIKDRTGAFAPALLALGIASFLGGLLLIGVGRDAAPPLIPATGTDPA